MFSDVWRAPIHILPSFPAELIPRGWRIDRSYDWGQDSPWSVGFWIESNGEPIEYAGRRIGEVRGDLIRYAELYGCIPGKPNQGRKASSASMAREILAMQRDLGLKGRVRPGPADGQIYNEEEPGTSIAQRMEKAGVTWLRADKRPGSRVQGWILMRELFKASCPPTSLEDGLPVILPREEPGLFVTDRCKDFIRTVPMLQRNPLKPDDTTDKKHKPEDHIADETRYRCRHRRHTVTVTRGARIW